MNGCVGPWHLQLVRESQKTKNFSTNEVVPNFKEGTKTTKTKNKERKSQYKVIRNNLDEVFGTIRNVSHESCSDEEQPPESKVSILSEMLYLQNTKHNLVTSCLTVDLHSTIFDSPRAS